MRRALIVFFCCRGGMFFFFFIGLRFRIARAIIKPERARINRAAALPARLRDGLHCITAAHGRHGIDQHGIYLSRPQSGLGRQGNEHGDFAAWRLGRKIRAQIIKRAAFDFLSLKHI